MIVFYKEWDNITTKKPTSINSNSIKIFVAFILET